MLLANGFRSLISFALRPNLFVREKEIQPPEIDGGGPIDTTTMRNLAWRTKAAKSLKDLGEIVLQVQFDPFVYSQLSVDINTPQTMTVTFPDGAFIQFVAYINKFTPPSMKEGEFPLAELRIVPTNKELFAAVTAQTIGGDVGPSVGGGLSLGLLAL
jgi:hypothetical protein